MPRGCLFGAERAVNACKDFIEGEVYGSIRHSEDFILRAYAVVMRIARAFLFRELLEGSL